ncbi:MAG: HD domain-containing protein [Candidatus Scalindua sp.]|nr:HD domain-containing protein [Candidatus Scalindua sp.]MCR4345244.1 HD domain-containing protein [Candidatus Scalindua sp.]
MRKESSFLIFGTTLSIIALIGLKIGHFYTHGLCNCLSGKLLEYIIPVSGLTIVVLLTNRHVIRLIKQREAESENVKKAYETIDGITRISDSMLFDFQLSRLGRNENYLKIIGIIIGTEGVMLRNKATACFLALLNRQNNTFEGNIIYKRNGDLVVDSETIKIRLDSKVAITKGSNDVKFSNWVDKISSIEKYQEHFNDNVRQKVGIIRNFVTYRIKGIENGSLIFFNYENDVDIIRHLVGHFASLYSFSLKQKENLRLQYLVIRKLADLAEKRDPETGEHLFRIQNYCCFIAKKLSKQEKYKDIINQPFLKDIYYSSPLHDIGKVGIKDGILLKPGKLTPDEMAIMKTHTLIGAEIIEGPAFLKMGQDIAHYHHEKWDGTGYPEGLKGEKIPLSARIMALADVYDALTSKRVYKEAFTHEVAESIIKKGIGSHFDPDVGFVFIENKDKFKDIMKAQEHRFKADRMVDVDQMCLKDPELN